MRVDSGNIGLRLIAILKLAKALLLVVGGLAVLKLLHADLTESVTRWARHVHLDPGGRLTQAALERVADLEPRRIAAIAGGMFAYAAVLLVEGVGLFLRKRWAEYFTVVVTAALVPLELYEIARHVTVLRITVLGLNLGIVWYLIRQLRR